MTGKSVLLAIAFVPAPATPDGGRATCPGSRHSDFAPNRGWHEHGL